MTALRVTVTLPVLALILPPYGSFGLSPPCGSFWLSYCAHGANSGSHTTPVGLVWLSYNPRGARSYFRTTLRGSFKLSYYCRGARSGSRTISVEFVLALILPPCARFGFHNIPVGFFGLSCYQFGLAVTILQCCSFWLSYYPHGTRSGFHSFWLSYYPHGGRSGPHPTPANK